MTYSEKNMAYLHKKTYTLFLKKKTSVCLKVKSVSVIKHTFNGLKKKHQNDLEEGDKGFYLRFSRAD